jgi:hypothetical protein
VIAGLQAALTFDWRAVDVRKGVFGLIVILIAGLLVAAFGNVGLTAGIAALFVFAADKPGPIRGRAVGVVVMTVAGSLIAFVAVWAGSEHIVVSAPLTVVVTGAATHSAAHGEKDATRGLLLTLWAVIGISIGGSQDSALQLALAFAVGGAIASVVIWLHSRGTPGASVESDAQAAERSLAAVIRSPLGAFSLLRASAVGIALLLGAYLFPVHPIWAALTVILVMRPRAGDTLSVGLLRVIGTMLGVLFAELVFGLAAGSSIIVLGGFLVAGFAMLAFKQVNYALFVLFLTAILVLSQELGGASAQTVAIDRLLATALGAVIAVIGIGIGRLGYRGAGNHSG